MNSDSDQAWHSAAPSSSLTAPRRRWPWLLLIVILVLAGAGGVYAWPQIEPLVPALSQPFSGERVASADKEALPDLLATQQKVEDDLAALGQSVAQQQDQLKTIVDQLAALTAKVDALERPAPPPPAPPPPAVAQAPGAPAAPAAAKPRRPPVRAPKPTTGPISVGGAPLPAASAGR
ncbi:MAG: hypothetical protein V7632_966 [Bradyrhizobium sp.]|jgi:uncharacterized coiled-coil protein SlyX